MKPAPHLVLDWYEDMLDCYDSRLTEAERQALHEWERSPAFTRTGDWPGWSKYLRKRPGSESPASERGRVLALLVTERGAWIPQSRIAACVEQYDLRISELRRLGFRIEKRTSPAGGAWLRLELNPLRPAPGVRDESQPSPHLVSRRREPDRTAPQEYRE